MKAKIVFFLIIITTVVSCVRDSEQKKGEVQISGKLSNIKGGTIYLEELTPVAVTLTDSIPIDDEGSFILIKKLDGSKFYRLRIGTNDFITLVLDSSQNIHITANARDLARTYSVSGSPSSELLKTFNHYILQTDSKIDSLENEFSKAQTKGTIRIDSLSKAIRPVYNTIQKEKEAFVKRFIDEYPNSIVTLAAINYLNPDVDFRYFHKVDSSLAKNSPHSLYTEDFHKRYEALSKLATGNMAPDILLSNPEGEQVALSSLKGKYVLVDFWASWCGPCRQESPNLVKIYKKFHPRGFEIYSVSLDKEANAWVKAIKDDQLNWIHVSDLKFWDSAAAKSYNVQSIPFTILIDKEGKIIAKALRGKELEDKLMEVLVNN